VREENRGTHALIAARAFLPDLILLDVMMPDIDGGELAAEIRAIPRFREVPIVFLTAAVTRKEISEHGCIGGERFLAKPLDPVDLLNCLREELQRPSNHSVEKKAGEDTSPHLAY
jgi:DNA-binding response OmpR family regulator